MKVWIFLLSVLAAVGTWWWHARRNAAVQATFADKVRTVSRSFLAGLAVYFSLMAIALIYLTITTS